MQLPQFWEQHAPSRRDMLRAFQLAADVGTTTDEVALHIVDSLLQRGFKVDAQSGPLIQTSRPLSLTQEPLQLCTPLQAALVRPVVLQRLLQATTVAVNQLQVGWNATLLHILTQLYVEPPSTAAHAASMPGPARKRLLESARLLLDAGADPFVPDDHGGRPLSTAMESAPQLNDTGLVALLFDAMHGGGSSGTNDLVAVFKQKPAKLIQELLKLKKEARPAQFSTWLLELPPAALRRAQMLLTVAEVRFETFDQLLELLPLAGIAQLFEPVLAIGNTIALKHLERSGECGPINRMDIGACQLPTSPAGVQAWSRAIKANPRQLVLYAMLRFNNTLHELFLSDRELLKAATQGAKAVVEYTRAIIADSATDGGGAAASSGGKSSAAAVLARREPAFQDMAFATSFFVSWMIIVGGLDEVTDHPQLFGVLGRETGHHLDCLALFGLGHVKAITAVSSLSFFPELAVDSLLALSEAGGDNDTAAHLAACIQKVVRRVGRDESVDTDEELRYARCASRVMLNTTCYLFAKLYSHSSKAEATQLLLQALPALARLAGSGLTPAVAAEAALRPNSFRRASNSLVGDGQEFVKLCAMTHGILTWAALPALAADVSCCSSASGAGSRSRSSSSSGVWTEADSERVLLSGMRAACVDDACTPDKVATWSPQQLVKACTHQGFRVEASGPEFTITFEFQLQPSPTDVSDNDVEADQRHQTTRTPARQVACWACGRTAAEAVAAGAVLTRGADGKPHMKRCSRCRRARYCSEQCQKDHWKAHKPVCVPQQKTAAAAGAQQ